MCLGGRSTASIDLVVRKVQLSKKKINKKNTGFLDLVVRKMQLAKGVVDVQGLVQLCHTHLFFWGGGTTNEKLLGCC